MFDLAVVVVRDTPNKDTVIRAASVCTCSSNGWRDGGTHLGIEKLKEDITKVEVSYRLSSFSGHTSLVLETAMNAICTRHSERDRRWHIYIPEAILSVISVENCMASWCYCRLRPHNVQIEVSNLHVPAT